MTEAATVRDLCRRWRYIEAKYEADTIICSEEDMDKVSEAVHAEQQEIEARLAEFDARGVEDACELINLAVVMNEKHMGRERLQPVLRMAMVALAWAEPA